MKFTIALPLGEITPGEYQSMAAVREMAAALEAAGIDACYLTDHPAPSAKWLHAHGHDALDPLTALGFVAAASTRLLVHTNILVLPYRNPFLTAKMAATLQVLSGGRLILGVGNGYQIEEFDALGADFHKRGKLLDEALETIRLAWAGGAVVKQGMNWNAVGNEPRPVPDPAPPIWIGGGSDKAVERAIRFGDGWSPIWAAPNLSAVNRAAALNSVEELDAKIQRLHEGRARAGRTGAFDVAIGPRVSLRIGSRESADKMLAALDELAAVGVTWAMAELRHDSRASWLEAVQWFGEEIIARQ
jgi:probable F420-dependent oxidoreductase